MVRNIILRIPVIRALVPRVSRPLLPLTRLAVAAEPSLSLVRPSARSSNSTRLFHHIPARLTSSRSPSPSSSSSDGQTHSELPPGASFTERLKYLIKSYGWYALGVYLLLGAVDFSVAFAGINILGAEYVAQVAASVKEVVAGMIPHRPPEPGREEMDSAAAHAGAGGSEGLMAMLVLAYTIHKTLFLPVRVGLTAAVTPKLVHWLRARGWAGSAGARRAAQEMREKIRERRDRD